jgi:hypothetical protein
MTPGIDKLFSAFVGLNLFQSVYTRGPELAIAGADDP